MFQVFNILATLLFQFWPQQRDLRHCLILQNYFQLLKAFGYLVFTKGWNVDYLNISNYWFILIVECIIGSLDNIFFYIPLLSHYSKLTPKLQEGASFALLTGFTNLSLFVISPMAGNFVNRNILTTEVTNSNLKTSLWQLTLATIVTSIISIPFRWYILQKVDK